MSEISASESALSAVPPALLAGMTMNLDTPHTDPFIGRTIDGKYTIEQRIGRGGSGTVYRARHAIIHRPVALKVLSLDLVSEPDALERFRREAETAAHVKHINLVPVTDFGLTSDGVAYLVMEFIEGSSLRKILDRERTLQPERIVPMMKAICSGVHAAHRRGIIHRDLKPDNVMIEVVDDEEMPRVLDFGIAKLMDAVQVTSGFRTETGSVMGTPHYMSPEQCEGKPLDARSDIYSLGVLVYEMLTGNVPFPGKVSTTVMMQQVTKRPPMLRAQRPDISAAAEACVMRAMEKDRNARQTSALDFFLELEAAFATPDQPKPPKTFLNELQQAAKAAPVIPIGLKPLQYEVTDEQPVAKIAESVTAEVPEVSETIARMSEPPALASLTRPEPPPAPKAEPKKVAPKAVPKTEATGETGGAAKPAPAVVRELAPKPKTAPPVAADAAGVAVRPSSAPLKKPAPLPRTALALPEEPVDLRRTVLVWTRRVGVTVAILVTLYAAIAFALCRRTNTVLEDELSGVLKNNLAPVAGLRGRVRAVLASHGIDVPEKNLRITLDPPSRRATVAIEYQRSVLTLPLRFRAVGAAENVSLTLGQVADVRPTEVEVVNTSRRELERYRQELQQRNGAQ
jgi:serine/threonine-protein kinase